MIFFNYYKNIKIFLNQKKNYEFHKIILFYYYNFLIFYDFID